ncbi:Yip1 family protein [Streptomyces luomodiensis]|uniref:Yip1 family protein n=1 Tax=Streptomyces luomodiensis TaxID=3026192 RepID=A0ABY9V526_9ACTN|nr:Yip1 family protein [Streptomyces sp. SCA4-21]WNE97825.1 Yip1 family protein [Streptomyces sp. SCA4-21]
MVAGFRIGRGRDSHSAQQGQQQRPPQPPYGQHEPYGGQPQPQWQQPASQGEPEYFGSQDPHYGPGPGAGQGPGPGPGGYGQGQRPYGQGGAYADNNAGHTQQFSIGEGPDAYDPYGQDPGSYDGGYAGQTYRTGSSTAPPAGPRLPWKQLLSGIVLRPSDTFWAMRDYAVWGPALIVTFIYGLLAVFGFDDAREDVLNAPMSNSIPWVLTAGVAVLISGLILGAVTHTLARQLGGNGIWAPTIGLSMLIMSISDTPRLVFALFLGGDSSLVKVLGWATWLAAGALFTSMVSKSHDLPWPKALGASAIQLIALLSLLKLGTL